MLDSLDKKGLLQPKLRPAVKMPLKEKIQKLNLWQKNRQIIPPFPSILIKETNSTHQSEATPA